jgi:hypothetical protein
MRKKRQVWRNPISQFPIFRKVEDMKMGWGGMEPGCTVLTQVENKQESGTLLF